jgi:Spy/CpxP family protein refolding chaperone
MKWILVFTLLSFSVMLAAQDQGDGEPAMGAMKNERGMHSMIHKELDLTKDQQEKMIEAMKANRKEQRSSMEELRNAKESLRDLLTNKNIDEKVAIELANKIGELTTKQVKGRIQFTKTLHTILNEEQIKKMNLNMMFKGEDRRGEERPREQKNRGMRKGNNK